MVPADLTSASEPDELTGFRKITHVLPREDDGELCATLVASERSLRARELPAVLYLHGFVDYFFQAHLAEAFEQANCRFFALDLRRYGRSLRPGNRPCYATAMGEYFNEIDWAIGCIEPRAPLIIVAHSTGGLIASVYAKRGERRHSIGRLILNSPFLRFPTTTALLKVKLAFGRQLGRIAPKLVVPQELHAVYGMTIHASQHGEWSYDLAKKPLRGFRFFAGWSTMITDAQAEVARGLGLSLPILVLHSARSHSSGRIPEPEDFRADTVLRVEHTVELAERLGSRVTRVPIENGLHDLVLSAPPVRKLVLEHMLAFAKGD
jgi:alpha-beta hydrolase superfamily lysophospholipase